MKFMTYFLLFFLIFSNGCASGGKVMTQEEFYEVSVGMTEKELVKKYGRPFSIKELEDNQLEYTYIERIDLGNRGVISERHYLIILKDGKVVSTKTKILNRPVYERNSYEMQTTQKE